MRPLHIQPPLLNSANPWCSSLEQLQELYASRYTGAVTTRTSLLEGFPHDESIHQFTFYDPSSHAAAPANPEKSHRQEETGSLNTLGYSPLPLKEYLGFIKTISDNLPKLPNTTSSDGNQSTFKPFIISVTGTVDEVVKCYKLISEHQNHVRMALAMEVNLSCPNIPNKPPPAYDSNSLLSYLNALKAELARHIGPPGESQSRVDNIHVPIGIKTPPYTYQGQYQQLFDALLRAAKAEPTHLPCPVAFITSTNTIGSSLLLSPTSETTASLPTSSASRTVKSRKVFHQSLNSANRSGIGGLAGAPLHPLALGNVHTIKGMLLQHQELDHIQIIGVGGVDNVEGYQRMRAVGASAVAVATALGRKGVDIFEEIGKFL